MLVFNLFDKKIIINFCMFLSKKYDDQQQFVLFTLPLDLRGDILWRGEALLQQSSLNLVNLVNLPDLLCVELVMARGETCCNLPITSKNSTD